MDNFISITAQTKIRVAQDCLRSSVVSAKTKRGMQSVLNEWEAKAKDAGFPSLRAWVDASKAAGHLPGAMLAPKWEG